MKGGPRRITLVSAGCATILSMMDRYSRQILFAPIGRTGQDRLSRSRTLLVGCGALGSVLAEILTRAGIGRLTIADRDYVDESNLQRQSLYTERDCRDGLPKAVAAARHLREINSSVELVDRVLDVSARSVESLVRGQDLILDGTDNFETRYLLNDASLRWSIPWVYGACVGSYGLCLAFIPGITPCLRCVLEQLPSPGSSPTCDTNGVIGPIVHLVAALESAEALKILTGNLKQVSPKLFTADVWENRIAMLDLSRLKTNSKCPACGQGRYEFLEGGHESRTQVLCGRDAVQIWRTNPQSPDFKLIAERLTKLGPVQYNEFLLRAHLEGFDIALFNDGRSIIRGTQDVEEARRIYAKFIGN